MAQAESDPPRGTPAPTPCIELRASGHPELRIDGQIVPLKLKRGLALLVYLSGSGRKAARSHLGELLWPDAEPEIGRTRLKRLSHEVNTLVGWDLLTGDTDALWLATDVMQITSDVSQAGTAVLQVLTASGRDVDMSSALGKR